MIAPCRRDRRGHRARKKADDGQKSEYKAHHRHHTALPRRIKPSTAPMTGYAQPCH